jgi:cytochrome c oxidase subunit 1
MIRRIADYSGNAGWTELNFLSSIGAFLIGASILPFMWNVFVTLRKPVEDVADPWDAYTLEWATTSPPPPWNFDAIPPIRSERPLFDLKQGAVLAHAVAQPVAAGQLGEMRADAPEEHLGQPLEGHEDEQGRPRGVTPEVSSEAPDATGEGKDPNEVEGQGR